MTKTVKKIISTTQLSKCYENEEHILLENLKEGKMI